MAVNITPIFSKIGDVSNNGTTGMNQLITAAANDYTGVSANATLVFTADATNGGFIHRLRFKAGGTNIATVARIYINNGSDHTNAVNNVFYGEVSLPSITAIATSATIEVDYPLNFAINPGFCIYVGYATATAAGWVCVAIGGKY